MNKKILFIFIFGILLFQFVNLLSAYSVVGINVFPDNTGNDAGSSLIIGEKFTPKAGFNATTINLTLYGTTTIDNVSIYLRTGTATGNLLVYQVLDSSNFNASINLPPNKFNSSNEYIIAFQNDGGTYTNRYYENGSTNLYAYAWATNNSQVNFTGAVRLGINEYTDRYEQVLNYIFIDNRSTASINVSQLSPANQTIFNNSNSITLTANVTSSNLSLLTIANVSVNLSYINGTQVYTNTNTSGFNGNYSWTNVLGNGNYTWKVWAYGNDSVRYNSTNITSYFSVNLSNYLNVSLISPSNNTLYNESNSVSLAGNITSSNNSFLLVQNVTLNINFTNGTLAYSTTNTSQFEGIYNFTTTLGNNLNYTWTIYAYGNNSVIYTANQGYFYISVNTSLAPTFIANLSLNVSFFSTNEIDWTDYIANISSSESYINVSIGSFKFGNTPPSQLTEFSPLYDISKSVVTPYYSFLLSNKTMRLDAAGENRTLILLVEACNEYGCTTSDYYWYINIAQFTATSNSPILSLTNALIGILPDSDNLTTTQKIFILVFFVILIFFSFVYTGAFHIATAFLFCILILAIALDYINGWLVFLLVLAIFLFYKARSDD